MSDSYSHQLVIALRLRDVPGDRIGQVVAEVEAFTADSGEDPVDAFGPVEQYSDAIAGELRRPASVRRRVRELAGAFPPAVGSVILADALLVTVGGGKAELTVGMAAVAVTLPLAALLLVAALLRAGRWAYGLTVVTALAGGSLMWAGDGVVLLRYPAWAGLAAGAVLLVGGLAVVTLTRRDPVIDPRTDRRPA